MTDLFLCVDPGGSQSKIIYQLSGEESPRYLLMPPDVEQISQESLDFYFNSKGWIGFPAPSQQAWLCVEERVYVVGAFADQFDPEDRLTELKYENALYKVLAALGVIVQQHHLETKKKLSIQLALLLPANEYNDRQRFQDQLAVFLNRFSFRGTVIRVKLERFLCRPEGGGLASIAVIRNGLDWLQQRQVGVLMLGHRNVSALYFEYGEMKALDSPLIGFSGFLDSVVALTSGLSRERVAAALFQGLEDAGNSIFIKRAESYLSNKYVGYTEHPSWLDCESIQDLATAKESRLRDSEIEAVVDAILSATSQYWSKLSKWLKRVFPHGMDAVVISGGAARFLEPELEIYFNCEPILDYNSSQETRRYDAYVRTGEYKVRDGGSPFTPIIWGAGLQDVVEATFNLTENEGGEQSLSYRLVDAYGLFDQLLGKNLQSIPSSSDDEDESSLSDEEVTVDG